MLIVDWLKKMNDVNKQEELLVLLRDFSEFEKSRIAKEEYALLT